MVRRKEDFGIEVVLIDSLFGVGSLPPEIAGMFSALMGRLSRHSVYDLGAAIHKFDITPYVSESVVNEFIFLREELESSGGILNPYIRDSLPNLENVVCGMLKDETRLDFDPSKLKTFPGSTQVALRDAMKASKSFLRRKIALPVPNWHFQNAFERENFVPFEAYSEDQFVANFKTAVADNNVAALILVDPAIPLMYSLSEGAAREIDATAQKWGVKVIVDEVMRGVKPRDQRDTVARHFTHGYVVEGFSKRFGADYPTDSLSYLLPFGDAKLLSKGGWNRNLTPGVKPYVAKFLQTMLRYISEPAIAELTRKNADFDRGLSETSSETIVTRPYDSLITSLVGLPSGHSLNALQFSRYAQNEGVHVLPIDCLLPEGMDVREGYNHLFRIAVGVEPAERFYDIGRKVGKVIEDSRNE